LLPRVLIKTVSSFCVSPCFCFHGFCFKNNIPNGLETGLNTFSVSETENLFPKQVAKQALKHSFIFSETVSENSLPNAFLTKKQLKTVFSFCSRKQFSEKRKKRETDLPNEPLVFGYGKWLAQMVW